MRELPKPNHFAVIESFSVLRYNIACTSDCVSDGENYTFGREKGVISYDQTLLRYDTILVLYEVRNTSGATLEGQNGTTVLLSPLPQKR